MRFSTRVITILFLSIPVFGFSQLYKDSLAYGNKKFSAELLPLGFIDFFSGPSYQGDIEFRMYKGFSMNIEGGGYFRNWGADMQDVQGYMVKIEPKLYLHNVRLDDIGYEVNYLSLQFSYKKQELTWTDSILLQPAYVKTFRIYKGITTIAFKYGHCGIVGHFIYDSYVGLGLRFKHVTSSLTPLESNNMDFTPPGDIDPSDEEGLEYGIGFVVLPVIEWGIRLGFCTKQ